MHSLMENGTYRTQCRRCGALVYDGVWIPPVERLRLQHDHRDLCPADVIPLERASTTVKGPAGKVDKSARPAQATWRVKSGVRRSSLLPCGYRDM